MGNQGRQPHDHNAAMREQQVLKLRIDGLEFDEIAKQTGYQDKSGAYKAYRRAVARIPKPQAEEEINNQLMRLNRAVNALQFKINKGDTFAIDQLIKLEDRRAKLLGLDAKGDGPAAGQMIIREYGVDVGEV